MLPLYIILIPFALFAGGVLLYGLLTMISLYNFGGDFSAFLATFLFWAGAATVLFFAWNELGGVDWNQPLLNFSIFSSASF
ncbi:hypothetical protein EPN90_04205 [Patescibacteria group bacterium]|nr:MAG: hypothetical protein EPN90_04205 [Patescibacteria group bacterium]